MVCFGSKALIHFEYLPFCLVFHLQHSTANSHDTGPLSKLGDSDDDVPLLGTDSALEPVVTHSRCMLPIGLPSGRNIYAQFIKNLHIMRRKRA